MYHLLSNTTKLEIDCYIPDKLSQDQLKVLEEDAYILSLDCFKQKWGITELKRLGKHSCQGDWYDLLDPTKSYTGVNPEVLAKIELYKKELDHVE